MSVKYFRRSNVILQPKFWVLPWNNTHLGLLEVVVISLGIGVMLLKTWMD